jgi:DnaJ-class molecular chaperone
MNNPSSHPAAPGAFPEEHILDYCVDIPCPYCDAAHRQMMSALCPTCKGAGLLETKSLYDEETGWEIKCPTCEGTGEARANKPAKTSDAEKSANKKEE